MAARQSRAVWQGNWIVPASLEVTKFALTGRKYQELQISQANMFNHQSSRMSKTTAKLTNPTSRCLNFFGKLNPVVTDGWRQKITGRKGTTSNLSGTYIVVAEKRTRGSVRKSKAANAMTIDR